MDFATYALKAHEEGLFGKSTELTRIQKLYARTTLIQVDSEGETSFVDDSDIFRKALEAEIDKETPSADSPDYKKFLAMKAMSITFQSSLERSKKLPAAIASLEPIKFEPEVTLSYIVAILYMECKKENLDYFSKAEAAYDHYKTNKTPCLSTVEIFGGICSAIQQENHMIVMSFFEKFGIFKNEVMQAKYVLPALGAFFCKEQLMDHEGLKPFKFETIIPNINFHMHCLIKTKHFPQLDHLLSILMFHLVKAGRAMSNSKNQQNLIDTGKAIVSSWYTLWAHKLIIDQGAIARNPEYALKNPIRTEIIRFEEFMEPGVEIYEKQFPVSFIANEAERLKVIKKGKLWGQRAIDYFDKSECSPDNLIIATETLKKLLKMFETLS